MAEFDEFAVRMFEEAKRFLEKAQDAKSHDSQRAFLHAALTLGFSSLEAHVNGVAEEISIRTELETVERALLTERDIRLCDGQFELTPNLKIWRLEDRIEFLIVRFGRTEIEKKSGWWSQMATGIDVRNRLTHPREPGTLTVKRVTGALEGILGALNAVYESVYKRRYPGIRR